MTKQELAELVFGLLFGVTCIIATIGLLVLKWNFLRAACGTDLVCYLFLGG